MLTVLQTTCFLIIELGSFRLRPVIYGWNIQKLDLVFWVLATRQCMSQERTLSLLYMNAINVLYISNCSIQPFLTTKMHCTLITWRPEPSDIAATAPFCETSMVPFNKNLNGTRWCWTWSDIRDIKGMYSTQYYMNRFTGVVLGQDQKLDFHVSIVFHALCSPELFFAPSLVDLFNGVVYSTHLLTRELLLLSAVSRQKGRLSFQEQSHTLMGLSCNTRHHLYILASSPAFKETIPWTGLQKGRGFSSLPKSGSSQGRA